MIIIVGRIGCRRMGMPPTRRVVMPLAKLDRFLPPAWIRKDALPVRMIFDDRIDSPTIFNPSHD